MGLLPGFVEFPEPPDGAKAFGKPQNSRPSKWAPHNGLGFRGLGFKV